MVAREPVDLLQAGVPLLLEVASQEMVRHRFINTEYDVEVTTLPRSPRIRRKHRLSTTFFGSSPTYDSVLTRPSL